MAQPAQQARMAQPPFTGVGVALVTLFDDDGEVDYAATAAHAAKLVDLGVASIVVAGTTGEVDGLTDDERLRLFAEVRQAVSGVPLVTGTGGASTKQARALTVGAVDRGADVILARSPRRMADPSPYYQAVAEAAGRLPVLAYHFPGVAPPGIALDVLERLPVVGCKDSSGDAERLLETMHRWSGHLYVGTPPLLLMAGQLGAAGAILALANAEPDLCAAAFAGDVDAQRGLLGAHLAAARDFPHGIKRLTAARFGTSQGTRLG